MSTWPSSAVSTGPVTVWTCGTVPPGGDGLSGGWVGDVERGVTALTSGSRSCTVRQRHPQGVRAGTIAWSRPRAGVILETAPTGPTSTGAQVRPRGRPRPGPEGARWPVDRDGHPKLHAFAVLFLVAVPLAGALTAGMLVPWVVGPGLVARSSANLLSPLRGVLGDETPAGNTVVLAADGSL